MCSNLTVQQRNSRNPFLFNFILNLTETNFNWLLRMTENLLRLKTCRQLSLIVVRLKKLTSSNYPNQLLSRIFTDLLNIYFISRDPPLTRHFKNIRN